MLSNILENITTILWLTAIISSFNSIVGILEWFKLKYEFKSSGIYSWEIVSPFFKNKYGKTTHSLFVSLFRYPNFIFILSCQLIASILILIPFLSDIYYGILCIIIAICYFLTTLRGVNGFNGGDSTSKIVFACLGIAFISGSDFIQKISIYFLAFQLIIAYSTPGWIRLRNKKWRSGEYLKDILRLETFSSKQVHNFVNSNKFILPTLAWIVMIFESISLIILFTPDHIVITYAICALFFHLSNAFIMGLNNFVWAFGALLPSFIWVSHDIHRCLNY